MLCGGGRRWSALGVSRQRRGATSCSVASMRSRCRLPDHASWRPSGHRSGRRRLVGIGVLLALAGCAGGPPPDDRAVAPSASACEPRLARDGSEPPAPPGLMSAPNAEPILEPVRSGGPNRPYDIAGETFVPIVQDLPLAQRGLASWYGRKFHGARTASGERFDMYAMTAAHPTLPIPSYARVRNAVNGREVVVRINDRGPFHSARIIDLSYTAALKLDLLRGVAPVEVRRITADEIRASAAARDSALAAAAPIEAVDGRAPP